MKAGGHIFLAQRAPTAALALVPAFKAHPHHCARSVLPGERHSSDGGNLGAFPAHLS